MKLLRGESLSKIVKKKMQQLQVYSRNYPNYLKVQSQAVKVSKWTPILNQLTEHNWKTKAGRLEI